MKLLLTGANGFIGTYFQKQYVQKYTIQTFSFLNDNFESLHVKGIDAVVHLSALVHQPKTSQEVYERVNIRNTLSLARKAKESGVKQFIFMSTIAVYDEALTQICENSTLKPNTFYGITKLEAEKQLLSLEDEDFIVSIIRPPMVYGFNAPGNMKSLNCLIDKVSVIPLGGINNKRSFVYVGNLCAMIECIIEKRKSGIFLCADDEPLSTTRLIELIAKAKQKKVYLLHVKILKVLLKWLKPSFYKRLFGSLEVGNTQTKRILDFKNPYTAKEGIELMVSGKDK